MPQSYTCPLRHDCHRPDSARSNHFAPDIVAPYTHDPQDGVLSGIAEGGVIVDHTTASAVVAGEVARAAAGKDVGFLDAPLSGGQNGAENDQLTIMVRGEEATFERVLPVMDCYAKAITRIEKPP